MRKEHCSIAIDGPSGAGKSTLAEQLARAIGFLHVDTGAIYRTVGLAACRRGISRQDAGAVAAMLPDLDIRLTFGPDGRQRMLLDGEDVSQAIRHHEISAWASTVSAIPAVRDFLLEMQRGMARSHSVVMDGRDIGTVVLPDAELKVFLTASPERRAQRRCLELREKGEDVSYEQVLADIIKRDENDSSRAAAPLRRAEDAVELDTSELTLEESIAKICALIEGLIGGGKK